MTTPPSHFEDLIFVNYILPVIKLYGFDIRPHQVRIFKDGWTINIGRDQNWVATLVAPAPAQHILMMTLYDGDFATDAFLVRYELGEDDKVKVLDEDNNIDVSTFPTYDGLVDPDLGISLEDKAVFRKNG
jgi:hypothetical protein